MKTSRLVWNEFTLDDIAEKVDYGHTASATDKPIGPRFLRITDIQNGRVHWNTVPYCDCSQQDARVSALAAGDIVFARTGATTGKSFLIEAIPEPSIFASYLIRLRLKSGYEPRLLAYYFQTEEYWAQIRQHSQGATLPGVNASKLRSLKVSLPKEQNEQRRLADILDEANTLRRHRAEAIRLVNDLVPSVFHEMFGDIIRDPSPENRLRFEEALAFPLRNGLSPSNTGTVPGRVLTLSAITGDQFDATELKEATFSREFATADLVDNADLLICRGNGNVHLVGTGKFPVGVPAGVAFPDTIIAARINTAVLTKEFLETVWALPVVRRQLLGLARTTSGLHKINQAMIEQLKIPYAELAQQQIFSNIIRELQGMKAAAKESQIELDNLFHSLLQRAFRGEL
jgi:type I restriction enzyme, S subunit